MAQHLTLQLAIVPELTYVGAVPPGSPVYIPISLLACDILRRCSTGLTAQGRAAIVIAEAGGLLPTFRSLTCVR